MTSEASMTCAALRDLTSPLLTSASPAPASGTSRMRTRQNVAEVSESKGEAANPLSFWNPMRAGNESQSDQFDRHPRQDERSPRARRRQKRQRGDDNSPSREQQ